MESESAAELAHLIHGATIITLFMRYALIAGSTYFIFYSWKKENFYCSKIQWRYPENKQLVREIIYSAISLAILGLSYSFVIWADMHGYSLSYKNVADYGWVYYFLSMVIMIFVHDTYFYWAHRLLHWRPLFRSVHKIHHLSVNPSPFTAFAFHPVEGIIEALAVPIIAFTIPHHLTAILAIGTYSILLNVMGHLGFELFPKYFVKHWLFKWHNSATNHNMHHTHINCNYGLYFNIWDRLLKTNHPGYEARFEKVTTLRDEAHLEQKLKSGNQKYAIGEPAPEPHQPEEQTVSF
jgi:lathosterol oxidase